MIADLDTALTRRTLRGTWATLLLPLDEDERIDYRALSGQLTTLVGSGVDGVYTNGTAGEFYAIDEDEFDRISQLAREGCTGLPCQLGASHPSAPTALSRIRRAAQLRPDAIQVILPDWLPLSLDEVRRTIDGYLVAADGRPLVLYNPPHAKTRLGPAEFGDLAARFDDLIGIKVAGGDADWYRQMTESVGDLAVFVAGHTLASGLRHGAHGAYSNVACLSPHAAVAWYRQMLEDPAESLRVEQQIAQLFEAHVVPLQRRGFSNPALDKALAVAGGWAQLATRLRWPHYGVPVEAAAEIGAAARRLVPTFAPYLAGYPAQRGGTA